MRETETWQNGESKILKLALGNKRVAIAVLGQALLDEGGIGAQSITIYYTCKEEAVQLWKIAESLGYANPFRKKKHRNHFQYGFSIKASKRKELYNQISPLPNPMKNKVFQHLANRRRSVNHRVKGETKRLVFQSLATESKTVLQLMLELDIGASAMRRHLSELRRHGLVNIVGKDKTAFQKSRRTANLWKAS